MHRFDPLEGEQVEAGLKFEPRGQRMMCNVAFYELKESKSRGRPDVQNIADKEYVSTCLGRGDCWFGARRTVVGTVSYRF